MNKIILLKNDVEIAELELRPGRDYFVGRDKACDIVLENLSGISRRHAKISITDTGKWKITNLSKNVPLVVQNETVDEILFTENIEFSIHPYKLSFTGDIDNKPNADEPENISVNHEPVEIPSFNMESDEKPELVDASQHSDDYQPSSEAEVVSDINFSSKNQEDDTAKHDLIGTPYLKFISDEGASDYLRLEGNLWTAGSDRTCEIVITDREVSPQHFQIHRQLEGFFIKDLSSFNGTFINGNKILEDTIFPINSGDLINVGRSHIQFELRDSNFAKKIKELPLNIYKNPMIFSENEEVLSLPPADAWKTQEGYGQGAVPISEEKTPQKKRANYFRTALLGIIVLMIGFFILFDDTKKSNPSEDELKNKIVTFEELTEPKKKFIIETYKLSQSLYHNAKFELALLQLNKIHDILPSYKDSRELEKQCILSRELLKETAQKEQERREREALKKKVDSIIAKCYEEFQDSLDITGANLCFEPAKEISPSDPRISSLISDMETRLEKERQEAAELKEYQERVQAGSELFNKALSLYQQKKFLEAMDSFEEYLGSGLPDPDNNMEKSKRAIASIRKSIDSQKTKYLLQAKALSNNKRWREAVLVARKAQEIDPYDYSISNFIHAITTELHKEMKKIFLESLIEEGFGNIEAAKEKWNEVLSKDVPTSDFYIKAARKVEQYGI